MSGDNNEQNITGNGNEAILTRAGKNLFFGKSY